jgi:hypothetical protein
MTRVSYPIAGEFQTAKGFGADRDPGLHAVAHNDASDLEATEPSRNRLGAALVEPGRLFVGARDHHDLVCIEVTQRIFRASSSALVSHCRQDWCTAGTTTRNSSMSSPSAARNWSTGHSEELMTRTFRMIAGSP